MVEELIESYKIKVRKEIMVLTFAKGQDLCGLFSVCVVFFFGIKLRVENLLNSLKDLKHKDHPMSYNLNELRMRMKLMR